MPHFESPVVVLGAGATKACGGPLTNELIPRAYERHVLEDDDEARLFLHDVFFVPLDADSGSQDLFPPLPLLMSLVDQAIDRNQPFGAEWPAERLARVRTQLEFAIFAVIREDLWRLPRDADYHRRLIRAFGDREPVVVSLNYDVVVDNAMLRLTRDLDPPAFPSYGLDPAADEPHERAFGSLLKLHGSLNWVYCPNCGRLDLTMSRNEEYFVKAGETLFRGHDRCDVCHATMRPVMITPTQLKDYRNPHISRVWYRAEHALRHADRAVFVGYSLPDDDLEVIYLMKRGLSHLDAGAITVVEMAEGPKEENAVYRRYRTLFGDGIDWQPGGFDGWLEAAAADGRNPLRDEVVPHE